jgi:2-hydroxychromene-2-carboxylate isomerase
MASVIDFYFDFSSPYSYIASEEIETLTDRTGNELRWRPLRAPQGIGRSSADRGLWSES